MPNRTMAKLRKTKRRRMRVWLTTRWGLEEAGCTCFRTTRFRSAGLHGSSSRWYLPCTNSPAALALHTMEGQCRAIGLCLGALHG